MVEGSDPAPRAWVEAAKLLPRIHAGDDEVIERARHDPDLRRSAIVVTRKAIAGSGSGSDRETLESMLARLEALA